MESELFKNFESQNYARTDKYFFHVNWNHQNDKLNSSPLTEFIPSVSPRDGKNLLARPIGSLLILCTT